MDDRDSERRKIDAEKQPLVVVGGQALDSYDQLGTINPDTIENVTVLWDTEVIY